MNNEIRNELLLIAKLLKENEDKTYIKMLLDSFENDIKAQIRELENQLEQLKGNLETLDYVKKELEIK